MKGKRGRQKLDPTDAAPSVNVSFRLSARHYDHAWHEATAARLTVPEYLRRILTEKIEKPH